MHVSSLLQKRNDRTGAMISMIYLVPNLRPKTLDAVARQTSTTTVLIQQKKLGFAMERNIYLLIGRSI